MIGAGVNAQDLDFIRQLAYVSGLRGTDGSGILQAYITKKSKTFRIWKAGSEISYFLWFHDNDSKGDADVMGNVQDNIFMGHVRAATKGEVNTQNAHPFDVGRIVGAHNGTLKDKKYEHKHKTDSELLFEDINRTGLHPVLEGLDKDSAYALSIFNKATGKVTFVRNDKRSLYYCWNTKRRVLYYASEKGMLHFLAMRLVMDISFIHPFTSGLVYTVHPLDVQQNKYPTWDITNLNTVETKENKLPVVVTTDNPSRENLTHLLTQEKSNVLPLNLNLRKGLNQSKDKKSLIENCVYCKRDMDPLDQYKGVEIQPNMYSCRECEDINDDLMKTHLERHSPLKLN